MAINSKQKGKRIELEWAHFLRDNGLSAHRGQQFHGGPDSPDVRCQELDPYLHFEVKGDERLNVHRAIDQAIADLTVGKWAAVAHRKNREMWLVTMPAEDWIDLVKSYLALARL